MFFARIATAVFNRGSSLGRLASNDLLNKSHQLIQTTVVPAISAVGGTTTNLTQIRNFRDKEVLKLRCNSCYFKKIDKRWWVLCNEHPRHKQREKVIDERMNWIVTHITRTGSYKKKHFQYPHQDI